MQVSGVTSVVYNKIRELNLWKLKSCKSGPRNLSTMKLAQGKGNNNGKEARLVEENEVEEVEEDEIEEETNVEEMSETVIYKQKVTMNGFLMMVLIWEITNFIMT
ncbi:hypothetical protein C5167_017849 [Papaver somniferum]|uniref:Uncharacterized protein n=1 Tax=Papaver somniferum TaxID=3469 RepID=A0A4Y7IPN0_PAPSO|nr:uncharacterized protein LOC113353238 [Papaver somniferum]RZC49425.1 hypothetical protein C5167_017849 [Papaver somniferum]